MDTAGDRMDNVGDRMDAAGDRDGSEDPSAEPNAGAMLSETSAVRALESTGDICSEDVGTITLSWAMRDYEAEWRPPRLLPRSSAWKNSVGSGAWMVNTISYFFLTRSSIDSTLPFSQSSSNSKFPFFSTSCW